MPSGVLAAFGLPRLCLLVTFVVLACASYLLLDAGTINTFLLQVQDDPFGYLHAFVVVYTLSVVVLFPCMVLQVMSGALYGFWVGMLVSWVSTSVGQGLAFLLGRYLFRPTVKSYLHSTWPTFPAIDTAIKRKGWILVCLLRLSPVLPYNILNYALAITPVSFWVFTVASAVATIPWTALYVYLGTFSTNLMDLTQGKVSFGEDMQIAKTALSGVFIIVTTVYGYRLSQRAIASVLKEDASAVEGTPAELVSLRSTTNGQHAANGTSGGSVAASGLHSMGSGSPGGPVMNGTQGSNKRMVKGGTGGLGGDVENGGVRV